MNERSRLDAAFDRLRQNPVYDLAFYISQAEFAALETVGQSSVIKSQAIQQSRVQIVNRNGIVNNVIPDIVRATDGDAGFDPAACDPHGKCARMMVAA